MAKYEINNTNAGTRQALTATYKTILSVASSATTRRIKITDLMYGLDGAPNATDTFATWDMSRITAAGTATATTPLPLDPADSAALSTAAANHTVEPTVTAASSLWVHALNQRASQRWAAVPGSELVGPATSAAGFAMRVLSGGYTGTSVGSIYFEEQ